MNISIVIPMHKANKEIIEKIEKSLENQDFKGKIKLIKADKGLGLADSLNWGVKKSRTDIIISLHQDCIPSSKEWMKNLIAPLKKKEIVASVSKVELSKVFWKNFSYFGKIMSIKEQKIIAPLMDEKGVAYKKKALEKAGLFDSKTFRTAGEDFDMWIKLSKIGKIAYPDCKVIHYHKHTFRNRLKKEIQLSNGFGALVRIYGKKMPKWWLGILKAIPVFGWLIFLINFPYYRMPVGGLFWIPLSLLVNLLYSYGFWKGFIEGRQRV